MGQVHYCSFASDYVNRKCRYRDLLCGCCSVRHLSQLHVHLVSPAGAICLRCSLGKLWQYI